MRFALQDPNRYKGVRANTALRRAAMLDVFALVARERLLFAATTPFNVNDDRIFFHVHDRKSFESEIASHLEARTLTELQVASLANQHCGDAYARYCGQLIWCDLSSPDVRIHTLGFPRPYRYDGREARGEAATTVNHTDIRGLVAA